MTRYRALGAVILAAFGFAVCVATTARATSSDEGPPWCITQDGGSPRTVQYTDLRDFLGSGQGVPAGLISQAADSGGNFWVEYSTNGGIGFQSSPNGAPIMGGSAGDGGTINNIVHYTVANGACVVSQPTTTANTPPPTTTSTSPPTTTTVTTTAPTTTSTTPAPPAGPVAYICESNSQTDPSVETRKFAYRLWDVGNFVPYAVKGVYGHTQIGGGYSLICNPYHFHLHFVQKAWVTDHGVKASYLDLGHYPVVSKKAPVATKVKAKAKTKKR